MVNVKLNCAGQRCSQRGTCQRYVKRVTTPSPAEGSHSTLQWASFDLEALLEGTCQVYLHAEGA